SSVIRCAGAIVFVIAAFETHTSTSPRSGSGSERRSRRWSQPSARSIVTTSKPSARRRAAIAAPMPRAAPVTTALFRTTALRSGGALGRDRRSAGDRHFLRLVPVQLAPSDRHLVDL